MHQNHRIVFPFLFYLLWHCIVKCIPLYIRAVLCLKYILFKTQHIYPLSLSLLPSLFRPSPSSYIPLSLPFSLRLSLSFCPPIAWIILVNIFNWYLYSLCRLPLWGNFPFVKRNIFGWLAETHSLKQFLLSFAPLPQQLLSSVTAKPLDSCDILACSYRAWYCKQGCFAATYLVSLIWCWLFNVSLVHPIPSIFLHACEHISVNEEKESVCYSSFTVYVNHLSLFLFSLLPPALLLFSLTLPLPLLLSSLTFSPFTLSLLSLSGYLYMHIFIRVCACLLRQKVLPPKLAVPNRLCLNIRAISPHSVSYFITPNYTYDITLYPLHHLWNEIYSQQNFMSKT